MKAFLFDFSGVVADIRMALIGEPGVGDYRLEIHTPVIEAIERVRQAGLMTALLTNNNRHAFLAGAPDLPLDEWFDVVVFSSDVGADKPDPAIFHFALNQLRIEAEEAFFFDDLARNVEAAESLGIAGHVVTRPAEVLDVVRELLAQLN